MTARAAAHEARAHEKWVRKMAAETARHQLRRARDRVRDAGAHKRSATRRAAEVCRQARVSARIGITRARKETRDGIAKLRDRLRRLVAGKRARVAQCCGPDKCAARVEADKQIARARAELAELRAAKKTERIWQRPDKILHGVGSIKRKQQGEREMRRARESFETDASDEEKLIFRKARKYGFSAGPHARLSELEQLHQWMADNPRDVARILSEEAEKQYREAVRDEVKQRKEARALARTIKKMPARELAERVRAELTDVPF